MFLPLLIQIPILGLYVLAYTEYRFDTGTFIKTTIYKTYLNNCRGNVSNLVKSHALLFYGGGTTLKTTLKWHWICT